MKNYLLLLVILLACQPQEHYDLVITHASIFDSKTGNILKNRTILIKAGMIENITDDQTAFLAKDSIDARGKLVTPGFVDTHIHASHVFGDYDAAPKYLAEDSLLYYRQQLSETYLPYGVTAVMMMGGPENWLEPILSWSRNPAPNFTDIYTVGGALISKETRTPYINHVTVESPSAARQKVLEYYDKGIRHIKLYWRLRRPEFEAAFSTADSLGMRTFGHIDQNIMYIDTTLAIGLRNYEHLLTLDHSVINFQKEGRAFGMQMQEHYNNVNQSFNVVRLEMFRFMHDQKPEATDSLITLLAENNVTLSTTIHLMAEQLGLTYFSSKIDTSLTDVQVERSKRNFEIMMEYGKQLSDKGVKLRIGTDCPEGGKAFLSEQLLLYENGFSVPAILQISTINGAEVLGLDEQYGSIEVGKKANILIWDKSPFEDYKNFLSSKVIIKDGIVYEGTPASLF